MFCPKFSPYFAFDDIDGIISCTTGHGVGTSSIPSVCCESTSVLKVTKYEADFPCISLYFQMDCAILEHNLEGGAGLGGGSRYKYNIQWDARKEN